MKVLNELQLLVVDDDPLIRECFEDLLKNSCRCKIDMAVDGVDAFEKIQSKAYDVVFSDYNMPRMNGGQLFKKLLDTPTSSTQPPFVLCSADLESVSPEILRHPKLFASFNKPHDTERVLMILRQVLIKKAA